ncbi:MAG TPA: hypothetical protein VGK19_05335 [Capsulimonadaceae bacterium]|jgi:hypothetical protein
MVRAGSILEKNIGGKDNNVVVVIASIGSFNALQGNGRHNSAVRIKRLSAVTTPHAGFYKGSATAPTNLLTSAAVSDQDTLLVESTGNPVHTPPSLPTRTPSQARDIVAGMRQEGRELK